MDELCISTDDLIEIMRYCSGLDKGSCEHCPLNAGKKCWSLPGFDQDLTVHDKLLRIAADRLEELNRRTAPENNVSEIAIERAIQRIKDQIGILDIRISWGDVPAEILNDKHDCELAIAALRSYAAPENKPLTLEQLRQMAGMPYWHKSLQGLADKWSILPEEVARNPQDYHYGERWIAYAHKPEGAEQHERPN